MERRNIHEQLVRNLSEGPLGVLLMRLFRGRIEPLRTKLMIADSSVEVADIFVAEAVDALGLGLVFGAIGAALLADAPAGGFALGFLLGGMMGATLPSTSLAKAAQARQTAILRSLPFAIDLIVSAMRAGLDFGAAVRYFVNMDDKGPLAAEFAKTLRENELGTNRITALQNMADRIRIKDFTSFVSAIALGTEMGSSLTDTMEIQGEELRKARFAAAENRAQRAPSLMILPMAVFIMPAVFIIIIVPVILRFKAARAS